LNDQQQALLMLLVFVLPPLMVWAALGFPSSRTEVGILVSALISGVIAFVKELLGWKPKPE